MSTVRLAIVGGGPFCTYALERLASLVAAAREVCDLRIVVFERTGRFGSGMTYDERQPAINLMNRVASQITFAADETNVPEQPLQPRALRPTFAEWAHARHCSTNDERFKLHPTDNPTRAQHGEALAEMFSRYVARLREAGVLVDLVADEVTDIAGGEEGGPFEIHVASDPHPVARVDHVLLVTGHTPRRAQPGSKAEALERHAKRWPSARYMTNVYPLTQHLTSQELDPASSVGVLGLGLTAIDVLLHLTEGREGKFVRSQQDGPCPFLRYLPSGREPAKIFALSPSGLFTWCRPRNDKAADISGVGHAALRHRGCFFTLEAIRALREAVGTAMRVGDRLVRQLDFERHVFPLIVLELAYVYYRTLFGGAFGQSLQAAVRSRYEKFLLEGCEDRDAGIEWLLAPAQECFQRAATDLARHGGAEILRCFQRTLFGDAGPSDVSPWGLPLDVHAHRFDWHRLFDPLQSQMPDTPQRWEQAVIDFLRRDLLAASQGNLRNPIKAACDGVWRDLRAVFCEAADFAGLTAASHRRFMDSYLRFYNRMSNGAGLAAMTKVLALVEAGAVDVSCGPDPVVEPVPDCPAFRIRGRYTGADVRVNVLIEARTPTFHFDAEQGSLYPNLLRRGLLRRWRNPGATRADDFRPGAPDLTFSHHPVRRDGTIEPRVTILGAPAEGVVFFQPSAASPQSGSNVLNTIAAWAGEFVTAHLTAAHDRVGIASGH
jgi:hypothetical protein